MDKKNLDIGKIVHCIKYMKGRLRELHNLYRNFPDVEASMNRSVYDEYVSLVASRLQHISDTYDTVHPMIELCSNIVKRYNSNQVITMDCIADSIIIYKKYVDILIENIKKCPTDPVNPKDMHTIIMNIYISTYRISFICITNLNDILASLLTCYSIIKVVSAHDDHVTKSNTLKDIRKKELDLL